MLSGPCMLNQEKLMGANSENPVVRASPRDHNSNLYSRWGRRGAPTRPPTLPMRALTHHQIKGGISEISVVLYDHACFKQVQRHSRDIDGAQIYKCFDTSLTNLLPVI